MQVARLGYIGIATAQLDAWRSIGDEVLAAEMVEAREGGARALRLRIDEHPFRCLLIEAAQDAPPFAGWEAEDEASFALLVRQIEAAGARVERFDDSETEVRQVRELVRFRDPDGYPNELYWGPATAPFTSRDGHEGYVTGELGLGHIMRHCAHYPEMVEFYTAALGFRLSDKIVWDEADASFLRCNQRHHSLALINESLGMKSGDTNHIMFEAKSFADVTRAYEAVLAKKYPLIMTLGRHSNCKTVSFYFVGPSGFGIEIGHGSCLVAEESWEVAQYDTTKIWGHLLPHERMEEFI